MPVKSQGQLAVVMRYVKLGSLINLSISLFNHDKITVLPNSMHRGSHVYYLTRERLTSTYDFQSCLNESQFVVKFVKLGLLFLFLSRLWNFLVSNTEVSYKIKSVSTFSSMVGKELLTFSLLIFILDMSMGN